MTFSPLTKVSVDIETDLIRRFDEVYPMHGAKKWFFNETLRAFLELHDHEKVREEMKDAVEQALDTMEDES